MTRDWLLVFTFCVILGVVGDPQARAVDVQFTEHVISTSADAARSVFAIDLDGDEDIDVLSASGGDTIAWYENNGHSPPSFTEHVISTTAMRARSVFAVDVDGDGSVDVLSASQNDNKIAWYESDGGSPPVFAERVISTTARFAWSVFSADVDGDGDMDVLSASRLDDKIAWYENNGSVPPTFSERVISTSARDASSVFAADLNSDGDVDVISASDSDNKIAWYENNGGSSPMFAERVISTTAAGAWSVFAADLDGDGDCDILSASARSNNIEWYENIDGLGSFGAPHLIQRGVESMWSVFAADVDGDGDSDVLYASSHLTPRNSSKIAWQANTDGLGTFGQHQVITTDVAGARSVFAADMDGDGDIDVVSASAFDDKISWYENTVCGDGVVEGSEVCDSRGESATCDTDCTVVECGDSVLNATAGEQCDGLDDVACPGVCLSDCTCGPFCGDGACDSSEDSCNCPSDCGPAPSNESLGAMCSDGIDNDCDGLTDSADSDCDVGIPTVSAWGLVVMSLLLVAGLKIRFGRRRFHRG